MHPSLRQAFSEMRRRGVFKAGAIYLGAGFVVLQVFDLTFLPIGMPGWTFSLAVWLVILGFPLTLALSWRYDFSLQGISRTPPAQAISNQDLSITRADFVMLFVAVLVFTASVFLISDILRNQVEYVDDVVVARTPAAENSIAVLPFENMISSDEDDYFGQGLAEDILHRLTAIPGIQVASRTASFELDTTNLEMISIGEHLAVRNVLEGSVRLDGDKVRIVAQLIDAQSGYHLWSGRYDRHIKDVFRMYDDISQAVVTELQLTMAPETEIIMPPPTVEMEAYDYYLQARGMLQRVSQGRHAANAQRFFANAVAIDPQFAEAWAGQCRAWLSWHQYAPSQEKVEAAELNCRQAIDLNPDLAEGHVAQGELHHNNGSYESAVFEFNRALKLEPGLAIAWRGLGRAYDEKGDEHAAENALTRAVEFGPEDLVNLVTLGGFHYSRGRYYKAAEVYERAVNLPGAPPSTWNTLGAARFQMGDFEGAATAYRQVIEREPKPATYSNIAISYYILGRFEDSVIMYEEAIRMEPDYHFFWGNLGDSLREIPGRETDAIEAYRYALKLSKQLIEVNPRDIESLTNMAHYYARLGDDENAMRTISQVLRSSPNDTYSHYYASLIHLEAGRTEKALKAITHSVELNYPVLQLRRDPQFITLHSSPAFSDLIGLRAAGEQVTYSTNPEH